MPAVIRRHETSISLTDRRRELVHTLSWQVMHSSAWSPPTDLVETEHEYVVRVEVAGMREADFEVSFDRGYLVISGTRPDVPQRRAYHQMEIRSGRFSTIVALPGPVDVENGQAEYSDGFLVVSLPKANTDSGGDTE